MSASERRAATTPLASLTPAATTTLEVPRRVRRERHREVLRHAWGRAYLVTARSGRQRLVLLVQRCPAAGCTATHAFTAAPGFERGIRTAHPCGRFVLHALLDEGRVAS